MAKYETICELMERRIRLGDYAMKEIPPEERLASEVGVSRMTARRAVMRLVERGILVRKPNGRVVVNRKSVEGDAPPQIALLMPAFVSATFERWVTSAEIAANKLHMRVRKVDYVHWDDPTIAETFESFDGVFLVPSSETSRRRSCSVSDRKRPRWWCSIRTGVAMAYARSICRRRGRFGRCWITSGISVIAASLA
jgi:DNA-binding transcriptional regulator YhcF (GntR family)